MRVLCTGLLVTAALMAQLVPGKQDDLIIPGERIGAFTAATGHEGLRRAFGAINVVDQMIDSEEGNSAPGTIIYKGDPERELQILWKDNDPTKPPAQIFICRSSRSKCQWHTRSGITIGTTLQKLEQLNKKPFSLSGFFWDYAGGVISWDDGKLEKELDKGGRLMLFLSPSKDAVEKLTSEERKAISGDQTMRSGDAPVRKLNPAVESMKLLGFSSK
ncbi:MAG: hypothetical protein ABI823_04500 [Bryobacteraceae bacterium]